MALGSPTLVLDAAERSRRPVLTALADIRRGLSHAELWSTMGWFDIRQRYSRSVLGPFWVTLSLGVFVVGIGLVYGSLFRQPLETYLPFLTLGIVVWTFISALLMEGCTTFTAAEAAIKQMPAPLSIHAFRLVWRSLILLAHNAVVVVLVLAFYRVNPGLNGLAALPGFALITLNGFAFVLTLGTLSARFRDIPPLIANLVQILFLLTPLFWHPELLGERVAFATYNPFYQLIELVRAPLLGGLPSREVVTLSLIFTAINLVVALLLYARFRWRVPYWL